MTRRSRQEHCGRVTAFFAGITSRLRDKQGTNARATSRPIVGRHPSAASQASKQGASVIPLGAVHCASATPLVSDTDNNMVDGESALCRKRKAPIHGKSVAATIQLNRPCSSSVNANSSIGPTMDSDDDESDGDGNDDDATPFFALPTVCPYAPNAANIHRLTHANISNYARPSCLIIRSLSYQEIKRACRRGASQRKTLWRFTKMKLALSFLTSQTSSATQK